MSSTNEPGIKIVPAHLDYLTIYNPSLGPTEQTEHEQIVFFYAPPYKILEDGRASQNQGSVTYDQNAQLRQIGLAQGMVNLAKNFSQDRPIDFVDTEKQRLVLHELEPGWWILAAVNLTTVPHSKGSSNDSSKPHITYSARELAPADLLLQQLRAAHALFLLHHGSSLQTLYERRKRVKSQAILSRYWQIFANDWDVLLHGNPALDMYHGLKLAAGGELGVGVGEEEWGSGERDVLEGLVKGTEGLLDLMVFRFGDELPQDTGAKSREHDDEKDQRWLGNFQDSQPYDGAIFSGVGSISATSQVTLSKWAHSILFYGEEAYGIRDNPPSGRVTRRTTSDKSSEKSGRPESPTGRKDVTSEESAVHPTVRTSLDQGDEKPDPASEGTRPSEQSNDDPEPSASRPIPIQHVSSTGLTIPPPIVSAAEESLRRASVAAEATKKDEDASGSSLFSLGSQLSSPDAWVKVLTLGYGSSWQRDAKSGKSAKAASDRASVIDAANAETKSLQSDRKSEDPVNKSKPPKARRRRLPVQNKSDGFYLIGLKGILDLDQLSDEEESDGEHNEWSDRLFLRTLHVEIRKGANDAELMRRSSGESQETLRAALPPGSEFAVQSTRVVVYGHRPFLYILLFDRQASSPTLPSFFRYLHHNLKPLHKPLLTSTSPKNVAARLSAAIPYVLKDSPIYNLIYNPHTLHLHSSVPNIPIPGMSFSNESRPPWTRIEALNVHSQLLNNFASTRGPAADRERQSKTSRNWWVVWMRLRTTDSDGSNDQEAILIRRAGEYTSARKTSDAGSMYTLGLGLGVSSMSRFVRGHRGSDATAEAASKAAAEGQDKVSEIGVDVRKYVESLLSLNR